MRREFSMVRTPLIPPCPTAISRHHERTLTSGSSVTLTAPYLLTARTFRDDPGNTSAEDTPYWSALLYVNLPTHP